MWARRSPHERIRKKTEERRERTEELHSVHAWNIEHYIFISILDTHAYELSHVVLCVLFHWLCCHLIGCFVVWEESVPCIYIVPRADFFRVQLHSN